MNNSQANDASHADEGSSASDLREFLDQSCQQFVSTANIGGGLSLETMVKSTPAENQGAVLQHLLPVELILRRNRGELPLLEEYLKRFPLHEVMIRSVFQADKDATTAENQLLSTSEDNEVDGEGLQTIPEVASSLDAPRSIGTRFGDFFLVSELGRGGMGVVYQAWQAKLGRPVALKMIRSGEFADETQIQRFQSEAEAAAKLDHPGIVPVFEVGEANGLHYFSMAYVEGHPLSHLLKDGPVKPRRAATIIQAVADALHYAHARGVVHRDIKPANILVTVEGKPRITDFGLAKQLEGDCDLTEVGQVMGTPNYMAPEQAVGNSKQVQAAADIYAVGATLYHMLTGRPPIQAASKLETIRQVVCNEPAAPRKVNPAIPRGLETICLKCLRKSPASRYSSAGELSDDLQRWLENKPIHARRASFIEKCWLWCRRRPSLAGSMAILILAFILGASLLVGQQQSNARQMAAVELAAEKERAVTQVQNVLTAPADGLPYAVELLKPLKEHSLPELRKLLEEGELTPLKQLRAAIALAFLGDVRCDFLVAQIKAAPDNQAANLTRAIAQAPNGLALIKKEIESANRVEEPDYQYLSRLALVAMSLGDNAPAEELSAPAADLLPRTIFIDTISRWRADINRLAGEIEETEDRSLQYSLLSGVAMLDAEHRERLDDMNWHQVLLRTMTSTNDAGVHSACDLALRRFDLSLPPRLDVRPAESRWTANKVGMTLVRIPAGKFVRENPNAKVHKEQVIHLTQPFWLASREITQSQLASSKDAKCDPEHANLPAVNVSWDDAVVYCNWLSKQEELLPCYEKQDDVWVWNRKANGYRLPTEAEWEFACRAATTTRFTHGDDERYFPDYAVYKSANFEKVGSRLPNPNGLFDMAGNVREWCFDTWRREFKDVPELTDPTGPEKRSGRIVGYVNRGSAFKITAPSLANARRSYDIPDSKSSDQGFRVARSIFGGE